MMDMNFHNVTDVTVEKLGDATILYVSEKIGTVGGIARHTRTELTFYPADKEGGIAVTIK